MLELQPALLHLSLASWVCRPPQAHSGPAARTATCAPRPASCPEPAATNASVTERRLAQRACQRLALMPQQIVVVLTLALLLLPVVMVVLLVAWVAAVMVAVHT